MDGCLHASISYFRKVSSEDGYDFFKFYIDDTEMDSQTGSTGWSQASFPVDFGTHTFKFSYQKDSGVIGGSDCAWVDNIVLPATGMLYVQSSEPVQQIVIYDLSGRRIMSCNGQAEQLNAINVNNLNSGIYFIRILTTDNRTSISKFIKQ